MEGGTYSGLQSLLVSTLAACNAASLCVCVCGRGGGCCGGLQGFASCQWVGQDREGQELWRACGKGLEPSCCHVKRPQGLWPHGPADVAAAGAAGETQDWGHWGHPHQKNACNLSTTVERTSAPRTGRCPPASQTFKQSNPPARKRCLQLLWRHRPPNALHHFKAGQGAAEHADP